MSANAREAHADGQAWVSVTINGGKVPSPGRTLGPGDTSYFHPIGKMSLKGPMSPTQSFVLWMAAKGLSPREIENECNRFGVLLPTEVRDFSK